jgi:pimeloyl-ACP methyl ester carboxylesterase
MPTDRTLVAPDGKELVVRTSGRGRPIVFLHGSNGGLDSWAELAADYSASIVARRGYRPSGIPCSHNTFGAEADEILLVARAAAALPAARRVVWDGESHFATSTVPGLVVDALRGFFDDVDESR